jgi:hypothetical protein
MCYIDGQKNKYSVLNECNRMLKYNIFWKLSIVMPIIENTTFQWLCVRIQAQPT